MRFAIRTLDATGREVMRTFDVADGTVPADIMRSGRATATGSVTLNHNGRAITVPQGEIDRAYQAAHGRRHASPDSAVFTDDDGQDDDAMHDDDQMPQGAIGSDARWNGEVSRIAREQNIDVREAARVLQMREPSLYWLRRCELSGGRVPKSAPRRNRHAMQDYY